MINIDEKLLQPLTCFCDKNNLDLRQKIEEIIVKNLVQNRIDQNGNKYQSDKNIPLNLNTIKRVCEDEKIIYKSIEYSSLGKIYEALNEKKVEYIIGELAGYKVVYIRFTVADTILTGKIKNKVTETHQGYAWICGYDSKIIAVELEDNFLLFISEK